MRLTHPRKDTSHDLDPVRRRRPRRSTLLRLTTVAVLVGAAATVTWSGPATCTPPAAPPASRLQEPVTTPPPGTTQSPTGAGTTSGLTPAGTADGIHTTTPTGIVDSAPTAQAAPPPPAGTIGVPIRLAEPAALRLVRAGDRVDVFRAAESARPIAEAAQVLAVTGLDDPLTSGLLLALPPEAAKEAVKPTRGGYVVVIRPDG